MHLCEGLVWRHIEKFLGYELVLDRGALELSRQARRDVSIGMRLAFPMFQIVYGLWDSRREGPLRSLTVRELADCTTNLMAELSSHLARGGPDELAFIAIELEATLWTQVQAQIYLRSQALDVLLWYEGSCLFWARRSPFQGSEMATRYFFLDEQARCSKPAFMNANVALRACYFAFENGLLTKREKTWASCRLGVFATPSAISNAG